MSSLIDQQDESELMPPTPDQVHGWVQNFVKIMGAMPDEIEEPTGNQLAGLAKRVISQGGSPYVDFAVWVPFERKLAKNHKFRIYTPLGDGSFLQRDLPGPASFQAWTASWRVQSSLLNVKHFKPGSSGNLLQTDREDGGAMAPVLGFGLCGRGQRKSRQVGEVEEVLGLGASCR